MVQHNINDFSGLLAILRKDAITQGLLGAGAGLLSAAGPSMQPTGWGPALGQGLLGFQQGYQNTYQTGLANALALQQAQQEQQRFEMERQQSELEQQAVARQQQAFASLAGAARAAPSVPERGGQPAPGFNLLGGLTQQQRNLVGLLAGAEMPEAFTAPMTAAFREPKVPETRKVQRGDQVVTEQWNPATDAWTVVGTGPQFAPTELQLTEIYDPSSPTLSRFVTEQQAAGQPAPGPEVTVSSIGKLIAERDRLPQGDARRTIYDAAIGKEIAQSQGWQVTTDKDGNTVITVGGQQLPAGALATASRRDMAAERANALALMIGETDQMLAAIEADPSLAGLPGLGRRIGQSVVGTAQDVWSVLIGETGKSPAVKASVQAVIDDPDLDDRAKQKFFSDPNISGLRLFENTLGYFIARLRKPDGTLDVGSIERGIEDAGLTGLRASTDVINRITKIRAQLLAMQKTAAKESGQAAADQLAGEVNFSKMELAQLGAVDITTLTPEQVDAMTRRYRELGIK